ncbi:MAG: hypothetical protein RL291_763 [Pseudomonadota bacterium]
MTTTGLNGPTTKTTIAHHLDVATLMSYAAGALPEALSAVAALHVSQCPTCARELKRMEAIGAAILATANGQAMARPAPVAAMQQTGGDKHVPRRNPMDIIAPGGLENVAWRRLGVGIWHARVPLSPGAKGDLRLIKVAPGRRLPEHGHGGSEMTVILEGAYTDELGTFRAGDVADLDETIEHRPVADPDVGCICLIAFEEKARFRGIVPRLVQPLTGM